MSMPARPRRRTTLVAAALVAVSLVGAAPAPLVPAATPGTAPAGAPIDPRAWDDVAKGAAGTVWVILRKEADLTPAYSMSDWDARGRWVYDELRSTAERSQRGLRRMLAARGVASTPFFIVNAIALHGADVATVRAVAARSEVARIEADPTAFVEPDATPASAQTAPEPATAPASTGDVTITATEWGISAINAPQVWSSFGVRGEGAVVGIIDTGALYTHPALVRAYRGTVGGGMYDHDYDWYDPTGTCKSAPCDNNGHGTHVTGTILGEDGSNVIGVAPGARWIAAKGCASSSCASTDLLSAGQWMLAPTAIGGRSGNASLRPHVVSNSWGSTDGGSTTYVKMVDSWLASGIFPVFANGNNGAAGCGSVGSPGSYRTSYGVGAYDSGGRIASFSGLGPSPFSSEVKPDISAPGVNIRSSWNNGGYNTISGTSMATPHVTGAVALLVSAAPSLIGNTGAIRSALDGSAVAVNDTRCGGTSSDNNVWGRGKLDAYRLVADAPRGSTGTLSGTITAEGSGSAIGGATVTATSGGTTRTTTAGGNGAYSLVLSTGTWSVATSAFGYQTATASVSVPEGTTTRNVALTAVSAYGITGTVVADGGSPVAGARVELSAPVAPVTTGANGSFSFATIPSGSYTLTVTPADPCLLAATATVSVTSATASAAITLGRRLDAANHYCVTAQGTFLAGTSARSTIAGDDAFGSISLPFTFSYYGTSYSQIHVSTNGFASFAPLTSAHYLTSSLPTTSAPNGIYPLWADLVIDSKAGIYTATLGTAPNRRFVVEWRNVAFYQRTGRATFGIVLSEASGDIVLQYTKLGTDAANIGATATIGIEKMDGRDALLYSYRTQVLASGVTIAFLTRR